MYEVPELGKLPTDLAVNRDEAKGPGRAKK
jgi:hypothetical protein